MLEISDTDLRKSVARDNPWWETGSIPLASGLRERAYFKAFRKLALNWNVHRSVILMGPRRVGKTVMLRQLIEHALAEGFPRDRIFSCSIDTPLYSGMALERLVELFETLKPHDPDSQRLIIFDEIQYLKDWEVHLKVLTDRFPATRFIASGSAAAALRLKSTESGAGRFTDFYLPPLTFPEFLNFKKVEDDLVQEKQTDSEIDYLVRDIGDLNREFIDYLNYGGYPEAVLNREVRGDSTRYLGRDVIDKVLLRDLPSLYGIQDIPELNRLFNTIAYRSGQEFSPDGLASSSGVSKITINRYLEYLEAAFLIFRVNRIDDSGKTFRRQRQFKLYLTNPSMRAALVSSLDEDDEAMGHMAETAIFSQWSHTDVARKLHYAQWKSGRQLREVDLVILASFAWGAAPVHPTEIKWSDRHASRPSELKGLIEFAKKNSASNLPTATATTRIFTGETQFDGVNIEYIPCALYCYKLGRAIKRRLNI